MTENEEDRFGLKHMTTNQEVAISFVLLIAGSLYIISNLLPLSHSANVKPAFLGLVMMGAAYLFLVESIRELEEKDHFLARKLGSKDDEDENQENEESDNE